MQVTLEEVPLKRRERWFQLISLEVLIRIKYGTYKSTTERTFRVKNLGVPKVT